MQKENSSGNSTEETFDFETHRLTATDKYRQVRRLYGKFANVIKSILEASFIDSSVSYHKIESRAKELDSFSKKAIKSEEKNPNKPRYNKPMEEITDLAGVRVITFFPKELDLVDKCIGNNFQVVEKTDKSEQLEEEGKFGYKSIHYLVKMKPERLVLPEYKNFSELIAEIQARTILQHAWAEMEHDIQYKSVNVIPKSIKRRFVALAGMLEIADREFQAIQDEDERIRHQARSDVISGKFEQVEITPDALKSYLDKLLGEDGRMGDFNYHFLAKNLRQMGFENFKQINECVEGYDDDSVSRILHLTRQGQISRFEDILLAGMGENYSKLHVWHKESWFCENNKYKLAKLSEANINIGKYNPQTEQENK